MQKNGGFAWFSVSTTWILKASRSLWLIMERKNDARNRKEMTNSIVAPRLKHLPLNIQISAANILRTYLNSIKQERHNLYFHDIIFAVVNPAECSRICKELEHAKTRVFSKFQFQNSRSLRRRADEIRRRTTVGRRNRKCYAAGGTAAAFEETH